jgi:hypothetical protein
MKQPTSVYVDPECSLGYVQYLDDDAPDDGSLTLLRDRNGVVRDYTFRAAHYHYSGVHIDVTPDDEIIGIEIIDIDEPELVAIARDYARDNDLAFPDDIRAAAARSPAA